MKKLLFYLVLIIIPSIVAKPILAGSLPMTFSTAGTGIKEIAFPVLQSAVIGKMPMIRIGPDAWVPEDKDGWARMNDGWGGMSTARRGRGRIIAQGAALHGTNGLAFGSDNLLYIASILGREIVVMNPKTGKLLKRLGPDQGVEGPDDLAFGPDGSLYWVSYLTGEVGRLSPDGQKSTVAILAPGVNGIAFSDDGRLFISLVALGDALYEIDPQGEDQPRLIMENLGGFNGITFGPDGFLYGALCFLGQVVRIDVDLGTISVVADGFDVPSAVKFDSKGHMYALESRKGEIVAVDATTGSKTTVARLTPVLDNFAFDSRDRLFVSSISDGSIVQVVPNSGAKHLLSKGGMVLPGGVAVIPRSQGGESVFVADCWSIRKFNGLNGRQEDIERHTIGFSTMAAPITVSADGSNLILSSYQSNAVQVWNPDTHQVMENYSDLYSPMNAIRFQGDLVAAELMTGRVVRLSDQVSLASGLTVPAGLAASDDDLWVGDWATGIVWQIVSNGQTLSEPIPVATNLAQPEGLAVEDAKHLLVVEAGAGRLSRIDLETGMVSPVAENIKLGAQAIPGAPPIWAFNGVAVGSSGTIYVTGDIDNVLYRFDRSFSPTL